MHTTNQIPATVRETFQPIPVVDEVVSATELNPVCRFMMEAQLDALEDLFLHFGERYPERFRETERGLGLIRNLDILLNGTQADNSGPADI